MSLRPRIAIGLSGGVDSAVSAALLKQQGADVVGVFLESWSEDFAPSQCSQVSDRRDAARVAAHLGIPFHVIPCAAEYRELVFQSFLEQLRAGLTPNPDAGCNAAIKFGVFAKVAWKTGATQLATGHYAQVDPDGKLFRAADHNKDQSYFLARTDPAIFKKVRFPIGRLQKSEVRQLAKKFNLPVAEKPDSQGLCFVGHISLPEFIAQYVPLAPGPVKLVTGQRIGEHRGLPTVTLGQRHGFSTSLPNPTFVVAKEVATNTVIVSTKASDAFTNSLTVSDVLWFDTATFKGTSVQLRYRHPTVGITGAEHTIATWRLTLSQPDLVVPGQVAAFYRGDQLVASGLIV